MLRLLPHYLIAGLLGVAAHSLLSTNRVDSPERLREWNTKIIETIGDCSSKLHENSNLLAGWKQEVYESSDQAFDVDSKPESTLEEDAGEIHRSLLAFKVWLMVQQDRIMINKTGTFRGTEIRKTGRPNKPGIPAQNRLEQGNLDF